MTVSRETARPESLKAFLEFLSSLDLIAKWLDSLPAPPPPLLNVHSMLIPFLLVLARGRLSRTLVCYHDDPGFLEQLFEQMESISPGAASIYFPLPEFDEDLPIDDIVGAGLRLTASERLRHRQCEILLIREEDLAVRLAPNPEQIHLAAGLRLNLGEFGSRLEAWGYEREARVLYPGTFALRGGIVDLFPIGHPHPARLELVGDAVATLRPFDPQTQRSLAGEEIAAVDLVEPSDGSGGVPISHFLGTDILSFRLLPTIVPAIFNLSCASEATQPAVDFASLSLPLPDLSRPVAIPSFTETSHRILLIENASQAESADHLQASRLFAIPVDGGFSSGTLGLVCASLSFLQRRPPVSPARLPPRRTPADFHHEGLFSWGDPVVHEDYGVGIYRGLVRVQTQWGDQECLRIEYSGGGSVQVHPDSIGKIARYVGKGEDSPISALGNRRWRRQKERAVEKASEVARRFAHRYAQRSLSPGIAHSRNGHLHQLLADSFPYDETDDQLRGLDEISADLESPAPMDRLLCGDVGFGKTELAIRAAFKVAYDGRQVAVFVPTTLLATQHFSTFSARLSQLGVRVALFTRALGSGAVSNLLTGVTSGAIDIVIGTTRMLSNKLVFKQLGLIIIDEEHRFGSEHKERIRAINPIADVLCLTATPIPRSLQMSLVGIRDISRLSTPPRERQPVRTRIIRWREPIIRTAIQRELARGGQVFFIHNSIHELHRIAASISEYVPSIRIGIAHGQMPAVQLEKVMLDFVGRRLDLLLSTTIVEAGLDIPTANTIFIHRAHMFGLSELHQMRGRVGRSRVQAYCYLIVPVASLQRRALSRLRALEYYSNLGAGYSIALRDLELRGPGNVFGREQSGHVAAVGYHLYSKIVAEAIRQIRSDGAKLPGRTLSIDFDGVATLDPSYIASNEDRVDIYQRLSANSALGDVADLRKEVRDRFGPLPSEANNLFALAGIRLSLGASIISRIEIRGTALVLSVQQAIEEPVLKHRDLAALLKTLSTWAGSQPTLRATHASISFGGLAAGEALSFLLHLAAIPSFGSPVEIN